jgi:translation elongation factor EF-1alpha
METLIGTVTHYYNRISVAVVDLSAELKVGDTVLILGHTTDFTQEVTSLEIEHQKVRSAGPSGEVAVKIDEEVRRGDLVYKVQAE